MADVGIRHSSIRRGRRNVLEPATLILPAQATVGIVGLNGAGKTTLFQGIADLLTRRCGTFEVAIDVPHPRIAYMPQQAALPGWLDAAGVSKLFDVDIRTVEASMPGLRLGEVTGRRVRELSGGQLQTLMFALCMSRSAHITLLDEPFANMDMGRRRAAVKLIAARGQGLVLLSAQAAADLVDCCDYYVVLRQGRYVFAGTTAQLVEPAHAGVGSGATADAVESRLIELLELGDH